MLWQYCLAWRGFALIVNRQGTMPLLFRQSGSTNPGLGRVNAQLDIGE
jgi:hypothetical protein